MNRIFTVLIVVILAFGCSNLMLIYGCGIFERFPADEVQTTTRPSEDTKEPPPSDEDDPDEDASPPEPDALISETLTTWGGYLGLIPMVLLGRILGRVKLVRILRDLVQTFQGGRAELKAHGAVRARKNVLREFDLALGMMDAETADYVSKVKKKTKMASVTKPGE